MEEFVGEVVFHHTCYCLPDGLLALYAVHSCRYSTPHLALFPDVTYPLRSGCVLICPAHIYAVIPLRYAVYLVRVCLGCLPLLTLRLVYRFLPPLLCLAVCRDYLYVLAWFGERSIFYL